MNLEQFRKTQKEVIDFEHQKMNEYNEIKNVNDYIHLKHVLRSMESAVLNNWGRPDYLKINLEQFNERDYSILHEWSNEKLQDCDSNRCKGYKFVNDYTAQRINSSKESKM